MSNRIFFRLSDDPNNNHALWSGALTVERTLNRSQARRAVAKHLNVERLPERTLVLTSDDLATGSWTADEIRAETSKLTEAPTQKRAKVISVKDVPPSMEDVQAMLKKFGLA